MKSGIIIPIITIIILYILYVTKIEVIRNIVRYIYMYLGKTNKFVLNYSKLPKINTNNKVVISFTYSPFYNMKPFINSILNQTVRVDSIYMILPSKYMEKELPQYLIDVAYVIKSGREYNNKQQQQIIPLLQKETECETTIISMNKNFIYAHDFIENIVNYSEEINVHHQNNIVTDKKSGTFLFYPDSYSCEIFNEYTPNITSDNQVSINYPNNLKY